MSKRNRRKLRKPGDISVWCRSKQDTWTTNHISILHQISVYRNTLCKLYSPRSCIATVNLALAQKSSMLTDHRFLPKQPSENTKINY